MTQRASAVASGGLIFSGDFDGGNLARVEHRGQANFIIWTRSDVNGQVNRATWFCFSVRGAVPGAVLQFEVRNMNPLSALFKQDMRPVYRSLPSQPEWQRLKAPCTHSMDESAGFSIVLTHKVEPQHHSESLYFAFTFPQSYSDSQARLAWLDSLFGRPAAEVATEETAEPPVSETTIFGVTVRSTSRECALEGCCSPALVDASGQVHDFCCKRHGFEDAVRRSRDAARASAAGTSAASTSTEAPLPLTAEQLDRFRRQRHAMKAREAAMAASMAAHAPSTTRSTGATPCAPPSPPRMHLPGLFDGTPVPPPQLPPHTMHEGSGSGGGLDALMMRLAAARNRLDAKSAAITADQEAAARRNERLRASEELSLAAAESAGSALPCERPAGVYFHRELLTRSVEGRRVDLLTISGTDGMLPAHKREPLFEDSRLLPDASNVSDRPRCFCGKRVVLISARVHPGETPSSFVLDGLLELLLRPEDPRAKALRSSFVFKFIPMLNPDGVAAGCYRADPTSTVNLNRVYDKATHETHPSIHAAQAVVQQLHARGELFLYVDAHAHAAKRGCFLYGNVRGSGSSGGSSAGDADADHEGALFAHLVALNCRYLDVEQCVFYQGGGTHAGSGREAVHAITGLPHVYTLECNYNCGHGVNELGPRHLADGVDGRGLSPTPPPPKASHRPKYSPDAWREVGKGIGLAALDLIRANPASRVGSLDGSRLSRPYLTAWLRKHTVTTVASGGDDSEGEAEGIADTAEDSVHGGEAAKLASSMAAEAEARGECATAAGTAARPAAVAASAGRRAFKQGGDKLKKALRPARLAQQKLLGQAALNSPREPTASMPDGGDGAAW